MKLSKTALTVALIALASLASAGPYTYDTTVSNPNINFYNPIGNQTSCAGTATPTSSGCLQFSSQGVAQSDWFNGSSELTTGAMYFTNAAGNVQYTLAPDVNSFTTTSLPLTTAESLAGGAGFRFVTNFFSDPNPEAAAGDSNFDYTLLPSGGAGGSFCFDQISNGIRCLAGSNLPSQTATLTQGTNTFFYKTYGLSSGAGLPSNINDYFELDVTLASTPFNMTDGFSPTVGALAGSGPLPSDPGTPLGIYRIGFAINVTGLANVSVSLAGGGALQGVNVDGGDFVVNGSVGSCIDGGCSAAMLLTDSEFDPISTPEPTTLLLLGSGLMMVARRFRR